VSGVLMMFFQQVSGVNFVPTNLAASALCSSVTCCISVIDRIGRVNAWVVSLCDIHWDR
jgi:hypothetical protein